jgi:hypothetical protein
MDFHCVHLAACTESAGVLTTTDSFDLTDLESRLLDFQEMSDIFRFFRINSLKCESTVTMLEDSTGMDAFGYHSVTFQPVGASRETNIGELEGHFGSVGMQRLIRNSGGGNAEAFCPSTPSRLILGPNQLHGPTPWFVTLADATDNALDGPGAIWPLGPYQTGATGSWIMEVWLSITFRSRVDPSTITARRALRASLIASGKKRSPKCRVVAALPPPVRCQASSEEKESVESDHLLTNLQAAILNSLQSRPATSQAGSTGVGVPRKP